MDLHEIEEREFEASRSDRLWDANPDVCCAAFQLGACQHTEAASYGFDEIHADFYEYDPAEEAAWRAANPAEAAASDALLADYLSTEPAPTSEEPF